MDTFLQIWGGLFYLLAKVFLARAEGEQESSWRIWGWVAYLVGVPAWVVVLAQNNNWIALAIETGGVPAMMLGIANAREMRETANILDKWVPVFTRGLVATGILYSVVEAGGINSLSQVLELGVTIGFLVGTYLLAKKNPNGWLFFFMMNMSMGTLMLIQDKMIFAILQVVSLFFVIYGFYKSRRISD